MSREPTIARALAGRVRELRERQEMTQADVARLAGIARSQILMLERGERAPTVVTVAAVARALGVPVAELFATGAAANPGPDRADRVAERLRALGPEAVLAVEGIADAMEHMAQGRKRRH